MTENKNNPLLCNPATGLCEIPGTGISNNYQAISNQDKPLKLVYFTDPICSSCWGIEPQLRKLKLEYGNILDIEYHMGGLLPDWSYNSGGISKPSDVAYHWDEVSIYYDMPIDGDVWLEDPLNSSYPPSIAFKAAEIQDKDKAVNFLRILREMVFLKKKNITRWEYIAIAAEEAGLDVVKLKTDFEGSAQKLFEADLKLARDYGVRGFPTIFIQNKSGERETIYGTKPYSFFETVILNLSSDVTKEQYNKNQEALFSKYNSLTAREYSELSGISRNESEKQLNELMDKGFLEKLMTKNGSLWIRKSSDKI
ncbi:ClpXP adapter SpxH family protein [Elizabethkingia anophelis]|uniref:ClpXP adapter SpxH family protein n=1 Tax=Elizabethkingia anophelis TaxID=1117645 RepID=UPI0012B430B3|nr:ClpXP adapter SpxH family protein [Elizabethkingia anophelis]QGN21383.1 DsbA family protein [Elizabethkingia anophelis]QNV08045.1 DsbA family protein [Elizabethkingia anophelis]UTF89786.1 DsbA family protein [Elizabethkingia anophelis]UTG00657.1 DsbA family protein [Elizabethkingia anophelis]UTG04407.1 DsbA family protein [Elizabethkingia anophelis]